jgi:lipopolysaccharide transport system ATP-binding protein
MQDVSTNEGRTVLFVSHNLAAISSLCTRAILLNSGNLEMDGNVEKVLPGYIRMRKVESNGHVNFNGLGLERYGEKKYGEWKSIALLNEDGMITNTFVMGEKMTISLTIDILKTSDDFEIGVGIRNLQEVYLHYLVSGWEGVNSISNKGLNEIKIELPYIYLFPGDYQIINWIAIRGANYDDAIHGSIDFRVEEGKLNEHNTYFKRFSKNTQVYIPSKWSINKLS